MVSTRQLSLLVKYALPDCKDNNVCWKTILVLFRKQLLPNTYNQSAT